MAKGISGRRHAQAVFLIALETNQLDRWQADLERIASILHDPEIGSFLENPKVSSERKRELLQQGSQRCYTYGNESGVSPGCQESPPHSPEHCD